MARKAGNRHGALRERIAHLAARIMAEDGVDDFHYAKRKAARQAGASDARAMPDNEEVERALSEYRQIYQKDEHPEVLRELREQALTIMRSVERFNPFLSGSVLSGVAGRFSDIEIHLFADSAKEVELFLLNRGWKYRASQARCFVNQVERQVPTFLVDHAEAEIQFKVFDREDARQAIRSSALGRPLARAGLADLEAMLKSE